MALPVSGPLFCTQEPLFQPIFFFKHRVYVQYQHIINYKDAALDEIDFHISPKSKRYLQRRYITQCPNQILCPPIFVVQ